MARVRYTNPFAGILANIAGVQVRQSRGGFVLDTDAGFPYAGQVFGPGGAAETGVASDPISQYLTQPLQIGQLGETARDFADLTAGPSLGNFLGTSGRFSDAINEALTTGFRTDIAPIAAQARRQFSRSTVPDIAERFAGTTGISSSDFGRNLLGSAADLEFQLGSLQSELDEAASGRRLAATEFAPNASVIMASAPAALAGEFARLEELFRTQEEATRPGFRLVDFLLQASQAPTGATAQEQEQGPGTVSQILGGVQDPAGAFGGGGTTNWSGVVGL